VVWFVLLTLLGFFWQSIYGGLSINFLANYGMGPVFYVDLQAGSRFFYGV
jgi:hypothetical protein